MVFLQVSLTVLTESSSGHSPRTYVTKTSTAPRRIQTHDFLNIDDALLRCATTSAHQVKNFVQLKLGLWNLAC